ncbi:PilW family protein [Ectothiorhodospira haloalkaliphila]|uniref:PilW family protein n=1 Tax=Ectothiorhodospira haloalkaliphila TaxID=421628 RepID=UPI001EE88DB9|nr:PilW family protein [Ectothiorhodospira haloalkaliphila]MCG5523594.1 PilW family protein [Ectothiorhodospira haloalkaliphila]
MRGITLVELMIAMVLGILLLGSVIGVFLGTSQTYRTQEAMSKVQETGRFAMERLARDIRQVGFRGACTPGATVNSLLDPTGTGYDAQIFDLATGALIGWHQQAGPFSGHMDGYVAGTDAILIKKSSSMNARPNGNTPPGAATVNLNGPSGIAREQLVVISDPESCDIFQNTANSNATTVSRGAANMDPGNLNPNQQNPLSKGYGLDAELFRFEPRLYYVGASSVLPGQNALRVVDYGLGSANDQELVAGIEDFRVLYGEDTSGNGRIDQFQTADDVADWENVLAVRVNLIVNSTNSANVVDSPQLLAIEGGTWTATDRRLYQVFTSTIGIRNRLN